MSINKNLVRCPRCGRPRTVAKETSGFFNIKPGKGHTIAFLQCTRFNMSVDKDDGCTFGEKEDPVHKPCQPYDIDISQHATIWGERNDQDSE